MMTQSVASSSASTSQNKEIARQLGIMAELHSGDLRRHNAYLKAAKNIAKWNKPILSG